MKKIITTLKMLFTIVAFTNANAQIINGDFENVKSNFLPSNWGKAFAINEIIDTATGITTSDEIQYSSCIPGICFSNFGNSHTGQYALEMANAFNVTQNKIIIGGAVLFEDAAQDFPPGGDYNFNASSVPFDSSILYANQGLSLGFYYKFTPLGNDVAEANLELFDVDGNSVGKVAIPISGTQTTFQYIYASVNFTSTAIPVSMSLSFNMAKEGSVPTFGSSLLIDDVTLNNATLQINQVVNKDFAISPTLATQEISVNKSKSTVDGSYNFQIINTEGKTISQDKLTFSKSDSEKIDISQLANGMYFLKIAANNKETSLKFIKK
jgi:hypothetical protein